MFEIIRNGKELGKINEENGKFKVNKETKKENVNEGMTMLLEKAIFNFSETKESAEFQERENVLAMITGAKYIKFVTKETYNKPFDNGTYETILYPEFKNESGVLLFEGKDLIFKINTSTFENTYTNYYGEESLDKEGNTLKSFNIRFSKEENNKIITFSICVIHQMSD